jgi:hypothetical protein
MREFRKLKMHKIGTIIIVKKIENIIILSDNQMDTASNRRGRLNG